MKLEVFRKNGADPIFCCIYSEAYSNENFVQYNFRAGVTAFTCYIFFWNETAGFEVTRLWRFSEWNDRFWSDAFVNLPFFQFLKPFQR